MPSDRLVPPVLRWFRRRRALLAELSVVLDDNVRTQQQLETARTRLRLACERITELTVERDLLQEEVGSVLAYVAKEQA